jgi:type VI secretion system protein ImpA
VGYLDFITIPVSEAAPCGPDLEYEPAYQDLLLSAAAKLPYSYFEFDRSNFSPEDEFKTLDSLLEKSRDVRLLVLAAKLAILSGDIVKFSDALSATAALLKQFWDAAHPAGTDGNFAVREANLSQLYDMTSVILPLQYAPLLISRKHGIISYRSQMVATKAVPPREREAALDEATIRDELLAAEDLGALKTIAGALAEAEAALKTITELFTVHVGHGKAPDFNQLPAYVTAIKTFLAGILSMRDPDFAVLGGQPQGPTEEPADATTPAAGRAADAHSIPASQISSSAEAAAALQAVENYFQQFEPSNPAILLVRQSAQLVGRSFLEAMAVLSPALAAKAAVKLGGDGQIVLSNGQLQALTATDSMQPQTAIAADAGKFKITSRAEASALLESVEQHFRFAEPSSPIPLLLTRARSYSGKDFQQLMKDFAG